MPEKPNTIFIGVIIVIAILGLGGIAATSQQTKQLVASFMPANTQSRLKADSFTPENPGYNQVYTSATTDIFSAVLEYNPQTNAVLQKSVGKEKVDIFYPGQKAPQTSSQYFSYQVQVVSPQNTLLQQAWFSTPLLLAKTKNNTVVFRVETVYEKNAIVRVILPNKKIIWTGFIQ